MQRRVNITPVSFNALSQTSYGDGIAFPLTSSTARAHVLTAADLLCTRAAAVVFLDIKFIYIILYIILHIIIYYFKRSTD